jgi:hypothetical protein
VASFDYEKYMAMQKGQKIVDGLFKFHFRKQLIKH